MNNPYPVSPFLAYGLMALATWCLIHLSHRLWAGNLKRGSADRNPVGLAAGLGFVMGTFYLVGFSLEWGVDAWAESVQQWKWKLRHFSMIDSSTRSFNGIESTTELLTYWLKAYVVYPRDLALNTYRDLRSHIAFPEDVRPFLAGLTYAGAVLVAIPFLLMAIRKLRGRTMVGGPLQNFYIGFLAPIGLAPIAVAFYGVFVVIVLLLSMVFLAFVRNHFRPVVQRG